MMGVVLNENLGPEVRLTALDEVASLLLEHGIVIGDGDELLIT
jgi:hypothetical protein